MKSSKLIIVLMSMFLGACNTLPKQEPTQGSMGVGEYKLKLELADEHYSLKEYDKALPIYSQINRNFPKDTHVLFRMGNIYAHKEKPKHAIEAYEAALKVDKNLTKSWYNLGVVHMQQSAKVWEQMSKYADRKDPLYKSARHYNRGMIELINPNKN